MSTTTGYFDFLNRGAASRARLILATENLCEKFEIVAFGAVGFDISLHSGTAGSDGFVHYFAGRFEKFRSFGFSE